MVHKISNFDNTISLHFSFRYVTHKLLFIDAFLHFICIDPKIVLASLKTIKNVLFNCVQVR